MPPQKDNRLTSWFLLIKDEWLPAQRQRMGQWVEAARAEPRLIWETPQVRYTVYGLAGLIAILTAWTLAASLAPPLPESAKPRAKTATFHVICTNRNCGHEFLIERKFSFDSFPVQCPKCKQETGQRALRCNSKQCGGKYVVVIEEGDTLKCGECGAVLAQR